MKVSENVFFVQGRALLNVNDGSSTSTDVSLKSKSTIGQREPFNALVTFGSPYRTMNHIE